ncbi:hypothetical protein [Butyrivibrio fibrisolvens]|uniref:hypothetical protein n=1 Tax=Butyrivibrio fibrisolvens TaxID=831 RepID=UPI0003B71036|nr:hypothetical protein [Butyrivibrio fibrisolvens]
MVAAYNDFEIGSLRVVNYFLTEYLRENIPRMFRDDFLSEEDISRGNEAKEKLLNKSRKS